MAWIDEDKTLSTKKKKNQRGFQRSCQWKRKLDLTRAWNNRTFLYFFLLSLSSLSFFWFIYIFFSWKITNIYRFHSRGQGTVAWKKASSVRWVHFCGRQGSSGNVNIELKKVMIYVHITPSRPGAAITSTRQPPRTQISEKLNTHPWGTQLYTNLLALSVEKNNQWFVMSGLPAHALKLQDK